MKKPYAALLALILCISLLAPAASAAETERTYTAARTNNAIVVSNGTDTPDAHLVYPAVYKIDGSNYFKLRDVAMLLCGSAKQFSVGYDDRAKAVSITSGKPYEAVGTELSGKAGESRTAIASNNTVSINGTPAPLTVFKIDGENYFKLRDLAKSLDFRVGYDDETKTVTVSGAKGYEEGEQSITMSYVDGSYDGERTRFVIRNDSDKTYTFGPEYVLKNIINGELVGFEFDYPLVWKEVIFTLEPWSEWEFTVDWSSTAYGKLKEGSYRLMKEVRDEDGESLVIYAYFDIPELCALPPAPRDLKSRDAAFRFEYEAEYSVSAK